MGFQLGEYGGYVYDSHLAEGEPLIDQGDGVSHSVDTELEDIINDVDCTLDGIPADWEDPIFE